MDDKLQDSLANLDEEQTSDLLDKDINFQIDKKAVARIKASTIKKIKTNRRTSFFSKKLIACAAALLLITSTMVAMGINNIAAAVQRVIEYIPGFGSVPDNNGEVTKDGSKNMLEVKVMKEPNFITVQGQKVEIYSCWISIYRDQAIVTAILRYPPNINLNGEIAIEYNKEKILRDGEFAEFPSYTDNNKYKEMTYTYTITNPKTLINTLTFTTENSKVNIALEKPQDLKDKVISQNFNGIIISAIPLNQARTKFILTSTYEKYLEGVNFFSSLAFGLDSKMKAIDQYGNEYDVKQTTSQGNEYYVDGNIKGKIVSLKFNKLYQGFMYEKNKSLPGIKFKVPQVGEVVNINKSLDNNVASINLKTVERADETMEGKCRLIFTYEVKSKIKALDISNIALYVEKNGELTAGSILEMHKEGDSYIVKYYVIADKNAAENTVNISPYGGCYYWNTLILDKECIFNYQ